MQSESIKDLEELKHSEMGVFIRELSGGILGESHQVSQRL